MKQHTTAKQHTQLSHSGAVRLAKWCKDKGYNPLKLSIGQMIEFLKERALVVNIVTQLRTTGNYTSWNVEFMGNHFARGLCDALWKAVKDEIEIKTEYLWAYEVSSEGVGKIFNPGPVTSVKEANEYVRLLGNTFRTKKEAVDALEKDGGKLEK